MKNLPKVLESKFRKSVSQLFYILAHRSRVPSFVKIREKLYEW